MSPSYQRLVNRLVSTRLYGGMRLGLQNMQALSALFEEPQHQFASVHIAGTNGKGSVATKVARSLEHSGYRVGLYTSPHIASFRERIQINGQMIPEAAIEELLPQLFESVEREEIPATFFELTTLLAFWFFAKSSVDCAVIETGLGGRLDATNIIIPKVSVITSIALDHTHVLGQSKEEIAREKAGIVKQGIPVVLGPTAAQIPLLEKHVAKMGGPLCKIAPSNFSFYDEENKMIAEATLDLLSEEFSLRESAIDRGLALRPPCRFERFKTKDGKEVLLDVAHNPAGLEKLFIALKTFYPQRSYRLVVGMSGDKNLKQCCAFLGSERRPVHFVQGESDRAADAKELARLFAQETGRQASFDTTVEEGLARAANAHLHASELLVVCGSFYIMAQARRWLGVEEPRDTYNLN